MKAKRGLYSKLETRRAYRGLVVFWALMVTICLLAYFLYRGLYPDTTPPAVDNESWRQKQELDLGRHDVNSTTITP